MTRTRNKGKVFMVTFTKEVTLPVVALSKEDLMDAANEVKGEVDEWCFRDDWQINAYEIKNATDHVVEQAAYEGAWYHVADLPSTAKEKLFSEEEGPFYPDPKTQEKLDL